VISNLESSGTGCHAGRPEYHADVLQTIEHGDRCDCKVLALAVGGDPNHIDFNYCLNVLQKRWIMECNHGCRAESTSTAIVSKIHNIGPLDPVKGILISNMTDIRRDRFKEQSFTEKDTSVPQPPNVQLTPTSNAKENPDEQTTASVTA